MRLSYAERLLLKITTIGSFDADKVTRTKLAADRRRERNRLRAADKRRAEGAIPRVVYEANSLSRTKPWEADGISRSTYDRRRKKAAAQAGAADQSASPHQRAKVDESPSPHPSSIDRRRTFVTDQPPASKRGAPQARPRRAPSEFKDSSKEPSLHEAPQDETVTDGIVTGALEAPPRPIAIPIDGVSDGLIIDEHGVEFKPPPPYQRRPPPKDWMAAAFEGMNRGQA